MSKSASALLGNINNRAEIPYFLGHVYIFFQKNFLFVKKIVPLQRQKDNQNYYLTTPTLTNYVTMRKDSLRFYRVSMLCRIALAVVFLAAQATFGNGMGTLSAKTITGQVISAADGEPLIGATIKVQQTNAVAATDFDGNFKIEAEEGHTLIVSYIGYVTKNVKVTGDNLTISLEEDGASLDAMVSRRKNW